jgi:hypothetical protein
LCAAQTWFNFQEKKATHRCNPTHKQHSLCILLAGESVALKVALAQKAKILIFLFPLASRLSAVRECSHSMTCSLLLLLRVIRDENSFAVKF